MADEALTAGAVARRLGVAVTTLRTWHQRYGLGPSQHVPGQHRRYTREDLDRLQVMRRLTAQGVTPAEAAAWARRVPMPIDVSAPPAATHGTSTSSGDTSPDLDGPSSSPGGTSPGPGDESLSPSGTSLRPSGTSLRPSGTSLSTDGTSAQSGSAPTGAGDSLAAGSRSPNPGDTSAEAGNTPADPDGSLTPSDTLPSPGSTAPVPDGSLTPGILPSPSGASTDPGGGSPRPSTPPSPGGTSTDPGGSTTHSSTSADLGDTSTSSGDATVTPGDTSTSPGDATVTPGDTSTSPGDATVTPADASTRPGNSSAGPGDASADSGGTSSKPGDAPTPAGDGASAGSGAEQHARSGTASTPGPGPRGMTVDVVWPEVAGLLSVSTRDGGGHTIRTGRAGPAARGLARAAMRLDAPALRDILEMAVTDRGVVGAWNGVIMPVLIGIGDRYAATSRFIEVEHLISRSVTEVLGAVARPPSSQVPRVMLAAADEEQHTLPLEALAAALAEAGVPSRLLGARVPPRALADAVARTGPAAVVLWSQTAETGDPEQWTRLLSSGHSPLLAAAAGPGWPVEHLPEGVMQVSSLAEAVRLVAEAAALPEFKRASTKR